MGNLEGKYKTFIKLDEDFMTDSKLLDLFDEFKEEGIGFFLIFLPIFNSYSDLGFKIPLDDLKKIRKRHFKVSEKKFEKIFNYLIDIGLFDTDGILFWNNRRKKDLLAIEELKEKRSRASAKANSVRWKKNIYPFSNPNRNPNRNPR